jgi:hypothetical protein
LIATDGRSPTLSGHTRCSKADGQNRPRRTMFGPASLWWNSPAVAARVLGDSGFQPPPRCDAPGFADARTSFIDIGPEGQKTCPIGHGRRQPHACPEHSYSRLSIS